MKRIRDSLFYIYIYIDILYLVDIWHLIVLIWGLKEVKRSMEIEQNHSLK